MAERTARTAGRRRRAAGLAAVGALWAALVPATAGELAVPAFAGRTLDTAEVLSPATESALEGILGDLERATGAQVAVLTVRSLLGEPIESYALRVAETWGLGSAEWDDGALLVLAVADRRTRIEVGYGLEGELPDIVAGRIIRDSMVPHFRRGDYEAGVLAGARAIAERLAPGADEVAPAAPATGPAAPEPEPATDWSLFWVWIVFLVLMPLAGLVFALVAEAEETRGIIFGFLLLPLMLGGSLALDELASFPPDSGKFLLGGVALLAVSSTVFWWLHFRLRKHPETRQRWRDRLDEAADGRLVLRAAAKLGLSVTPEAAGWTRRLRWTLVALFYLALGVWIFISWAVGYAIFYLFNLLWLIVIYRATLHPSPSSASSRSWSGRSRSWSGRSTGRASSSARSRSRASSSGGFRPGGGSFGGGGASGSW